jgi:CRP-like cAMP-binding protein
LIFKLRNLGLDSDNVRAFLSLFKWARAIRRGDEIVRVGSSQKILTVMLSGVACRYRMTDNGRRQIFAFQYPGDFCDYCRYVMPQRDDAVAALTNCLVGIIPHEAFERIIERHPQISLAFWRNTVLEARIFEERVLNGTQRPAVERVATLLCEQIFRLEAVGIVSDVVPLTQIDLADAVGLSVVHVNRTIQDLREVGALSKNSRSIRVENKDRLVQVAKFDAGYLVGIWTRFDRRQELAGHRGKANERGLTAEREPRTKSSVSLVMSRRQNSINHGCGGRRPSRLANKDSSQRDWK